MAIYDVTKLGSGLEFDATSASQITSLKIDDTHFVNIWYRSSELLYAQVFSINKTTGAIASVGALFTLDTTNDGGISACMADSNHFIVSWDYNTDDGATQVFEINLSTWAITAKGSTTYYGSNQIDYTSTFLLDSTHFVVLWSKTSLGYAQVFSINTSTWQTTALGTAYNIATDSYGFKNIKGKMIDSTHFVAIYGRGNSGAYSQNSQAFSINTSTWAITAGTANNNYNTTNGGSNYHDIEKIDDTHFLHFWSGTNDDGYAQVFEVNTSTLAITYLSSAIEFDTSNLFLSQSVLFNSNHALLFWTGGASNYGYVQSFEINTSTYAVTTNGSALSLQNNICDFRFGSLLLDTGLVIGSWGGTDGDGFSQLFSIEIPVPPTITTQDASAISQIFATANGNITATGGVNATRRGFCYLQGTSGDPTTANSVVYDDGSFGTGAYTKTITGLSPNTSYRVRAYAVNSVGTSYGATVDLTTLGTNCKINIGDVFKDIESIQINIGDTWKTVESAQINIGDTWKTIY